MTEAIYVNMSVSDLDRSMRFFKALGFAFEPKFTNDQAAALILSSNIYCMLQTHESMRRFTQKLIADPSKTTEAIYSLQVESRERADELADTALRSGGGKARDPEDYGFMYGRSFEDPDGHIWEAFWMDPRKMGA